MLESLEKLRERVSVVGERVVEELAWPVLLARDVIEGDLSFADPDEDEVTNVILRPGATLMLSVRVSARERMASPRRAGRKPVPEERYAVLTPRAGGTISVGRGPDNDLVLKDPSVSSRHARLHPVPGTDWCFAVDLGSRNGTAHNDSRLAQGQRAELLPGDEIAFGRQVFVFLTPSDVYRYIVGEL